MRTPIPFPSVALAALLAAALAAGSVPATADASAATAGTVTPLGEVAAGTQALQWRPCQGADLKDFECAFLRVPLDWNRPAGGTMRIAMTRHRSTGTRQQRIGSLFFNPGGPGGSGLLAAPDTFALLPETVIDRFDFVTWDPRGVGRSAGMDDCETGMLEPPLTGPVDWARVHDRYRASQRDANRACQRKYADLIGHVGTRQVVRDLDAMRAAVGDRKLTYWGLSYGTRIGYAYAQTFPTRMRTILLDGSVNPNSSIRDLGVNYGTAADSALGLFFQQYPGASRQYRAAARALARKLLALPSGRTFSRWNLHNLLEQVAGSERVGNASWIVGNRYLDVVTAALGNRVPARRAKRILDRMQPSRQTATIGGVSAAVDCIDYADRPTASDQDALAGQVRVQAPISGWLNGIYMLAQCEGLDVRADPVPGDFGTSPARMLLLGSTRDARTPYVWTAAMARAFPASRVVTYVGGQHGTYLAPGSRCVDRVVNRFFVRRALPQHDAACPNVARG